MKSKIYQLMLLSGALTVSFVAQAADVNNKIIVNDDNGRVVSSVNNSGDEKKKNDANVYGHVKDAKTDELFLMLLCK